MLKHKRKLGLIAGVLLALIIINIDIAGLSSQGQYCLGLSLMIVIFWATDVAHPGYTSGLYLVLLVCLNVAPTSEIFSLWTSSTIYLVIGAYLIAGAVESSGLGERIAYNFLIRFISTYKSIIISIFCLTFVLSLFIPHPWPRAFLIMSVIATVIKSANISENDAAKICFAVFASSVPISMIFLTGDSAINIMAVEISNTNLTWFSWLYYMGLPAFIASCLTLILILKIFKPEKEIEFSDLKIQQKLNELGPMTTKEKRTIVWIIIAIILWMTDSLHGIELGWITLAIAMIMSLPIVGEVLETEDWKRVPAQVLLFFTAAVSIGRIGELTGMNSWIASVILPDSIPSNIFLLALIISVISILLHMVLGSVIAVMGITIPAFLVYFSGSDLNPIVPTLFVYTAIASHFVLPFHHLNILVGLGAENSIYTDREVIKLGLPMTIIVFIIVFFEIFWWKIIGLL